MNLQELTEVTDELAEASMRSVGPQRLVNGTDSMVSLCAAAKGRSPSPLLNGILKRFSSRDLAGRKSMGNTKVGTKDNPSDDPSRDVPLRDPAPAPAWLGPLLKPYA